MAVPISSSFGVRSGLNQSRISRNADTAKLANSPSVEPISLSAPANAMKGAKASQIPISKTLLDGAAGGALQYFHWKYFLGAAWRLVNRNISSVNIGMRKPA